MKKHCGQSAVEFVLVVPFLVFLLAVSVGMTMQCVKHEREMFRWFSDARAAKVFVPKRKLGTAGISALPHGLSNEALTGVDNPSPHCRRNEGYGGPWECR